MDTPCCGAGPGASACLTITQALNLAQAAASAGKPAQSLVIDVANGNQPDWKAPETWPLQPSNGVVIHAPGIYFAAPGGETPFVVQAGPGSDLTTVTLEGDPGTPISLGFDSSGAEVADTGLSVAGRELVLQNAQVAGASFGIEVNQAGTLLLGPGPVSVGGAANPPVAGSVGIDCQNAGSGVQDQGDGGSVLSIRDQATDELQSQTGCLVTLAQSPIFGPPPGQACANPKPDLTGIQVLGTGVVQLSNAWISCMDRDGVDAFADAQGAQVALFGCTITHCGCSGLYAGAGTFAPIQNTRIGMNRHGVVMASRSPPGSVVDLSAGGNEVSCDTKTEPSAFCAADTGPGTDVWNNSDTFMNASGVSWATSPPPIYECATVVATGGLDIPEDCTCVFGSCPAAIPDDGLTIVLAPPPGQPLAGVDTGAPSLATICPG